MLNEMFIVLCLVMLIGRDAFAGKAFLPFSKSLQMLQSQVPDKNVTLLLKETIENMSKCLSDGSLSRDQAAECVKQAKSRFPQALHDALYPEFEEKICQQQPANEKVSK